MKIRIAILADDRVKDMRFVPAFGFSSYIEVDGHAILFDVDSSWSTVKYNADVLNIDLSKVEAVAISHWHGDHYGGLRQCLEWFSTIGKTPRIVVPSKRLGFAAEVEARKGLEIVPKVLSSGSVRTFGIEEQAIIVDTPRGPIIVTGCCHPGLDKFIEIALEITGSDKVFGIVGGLHIGYDEALDLIPLLRSVDIGFVAPCHCTGDDAIELFAKEFGDKFVPTYVGKVISFSL